MKTPVSTKNRVIFQIVLAARRPFTPHELQIASELALEEYTTFEEIEGQILDDDAFKGVLNDLCGLLLTVYNDKVYMIHQTAREFLIAKVEVATVEIGQCEGSIKSQDADRIMARTCMRMLALKEFRSSILADSMTDDTIDNYTTETIITAGSGESDLGGNSTELSINSLDEPEGSPGWHHRESDIDWTYGVNELDEWSDYNEACLYFNFRNLASRYRLLEYSAVHWTEYYKAVEDASEADLLSLAVLLCDTSSHACFIWTFFWNVCKHRTVSGLWYSKNIPPVLNNIKLAVYCGIKSVLQRSLDDGADISTLAAIRPCITSLAEFTTSSRALAFRKYRSLEEFEMEEKAAKEYYSKETAIRTLEQEAIAEFSFLKEEVSFLEEEATIELSFLAKRFKANKEAAKSSSYRRQDSSILGFLYDVDHAYGLESIVNFLLESGIDPNIAIKGSSWGSGRIKMKWDMTTLLNWACYVGHNALVTKLIQGGAIVEYEGVYEKTSLSIAVGRGNMEIVKQLVEHGARIQSEVVIRMNHTDDRETCEFILRSPTSPQFQLIGPWAPTKMRSFFCNLGVSDQVDLSLRSLIVEGIPLRVVNHHGVEYIRDFSPGLSQKLGLNLLKVIFQLYKDDPQMLGGPKMFFDEEEMEEAMSSLDGIHIKREWSQVRTVIVRMPEANERLEDAVDFPNDKNLKHVGRWK